MEGIKETKEALLAVVVLGAFVAERAKDGLKLDDLSALVTKFVTDPEFKTKLEMGVQGIDKVPAEVKDMTFVEVLELAQIIPDILEIFKSMKAA
jgi:hypothetical protein